MKFTGYHIEKNPAYMFILLDRFFFYFKLYWFDSVDSLL